MAQLRVSHDHSRTKLLNRLGMFQQPPALPPTPPPFRATRVSTASMIRSCALGDSMPIKAQLKGSDNNNSILSSPPPSSATSSSTASTRSTVKFNPTVSMIRIPSRYQYSPRIKKCIWSDGYEIKENAERNMIEFEAEGFDWRNVVLDDEMYVDSYNGHLIHPCHVNDYSKENSEEEEDEYDHRPNDGFQMLQKGCSFFQEEQKL
jgi:hypothetical protein